MLFAVACSPSDLVLGASRSCTAPIEEALDPSSGVHVLDPADATFDVLTPTSGPHVVGATPGGVHERQLAPAIQVSMLEQGGVIISVRADRDDAFDAASALAGERVAVQRVDGLDAEVEATAWRTRMTCSDVDTEQLERFVDARVGRPDLAPTHE